MEKMIYSRKQMYSCREYMGIRNGMKHMGKGESGRFFYGLVPLGNHAVCQKGGNRYERLTLKHGWSYIVCCTRQLIF